MALHYQTEYALGNRGRVRRTYSGMQALIAIAVDLLLGLFFGLIGLAIRVVGSLLVTTIRAAVAAMRIPLRVARAVAAVLEPRRTSKPRCAFVTDL